MERNSFFIDHQLKSAHNEFRDQTIVIMSVQQRSPKFQGTLQAMLAMPDLHHNPAFSDQV